MRTDQISLNNSKTKLYSRRPLTLAMATATADQLTKQLVVQCTGQPAPYTVLSPSVTRDRIVFVYPSAGRTLRQSEPIFPTVFAAVPALFALAWLILHCLGSRWYLSIRVSLSQEMNAELRWSRSAKEPSSVMDEFRINGPRRS